MHVINFSHPITLAQIDQIQQAIKSPEALHVLDLPTQFDAHKPFADQARVLINSTGLTPVQWQTEPLLVNLPGLSSVAAIVLAELHGRMGHFPTIIRLRPIPNTSPMQYELAELLNLQTVRNEARTTR